MTKISKNSIIHTVIKERKGAADIFRKYKMKCQSCSGGKQETLEWGANMHGVDIDELVKKLSSS